MGGMSVGARNYILNPSKQDERDQVFPFRNIFSYEFPRVAQELPRYKK
jgi:hypothetical protein